MEFWNTIKTVLDQYQSVTELLIFVGILLVSYLSYLITKRLIVGLLKRLAEKSKTKFDDALVRSKTLDRAAYFIPLLVIDIMAPLLPSASAILSKTVHILEVWVLLQSLVALLNGINLYYETKSIAKERPIKGYIQITIIALYVIAVIVIIGLLTGQSVWVLLSGVGAMTAIILLIFKDTILSFVAGIEITSYDLLHVGDWIEMPEFGADGDVIDIALHTVKVQNWDKTITVIPTHKLTSNSFKNWRGMQQAGGRRIKRAVYIDQNSIRFCTPQMIERFRKIQLLKDYIERKEEELERYNREHNIDDSVLVNGRRMTNIGTFRAYVYAYLKNHPKIKHDMTTMVRQLPPGPNGLPVEIYVFTNDIVWENYEAIQADIFDHLLSIVPQFDLRIFQNPTGHDFRALAEGSLTV